MKGLGRILLRVLAGAFALVLALSLLSFYYNDPCPPFSQGQMSGTIQNLCGLFGAYLAGFFQTLVGVGAWLIPVYVLWECFPASSLKWYQRVAWLTLALAIWTTLGAFGSRSFAGLDGPSANQWRWGGWLGSSLWEAGRKALGPIGLPLVLGTLILLSSVLVAPVLTRALGRLLAKWMGDKAWPWLKPLPSKGARGVLDMLQRPFLSWRARTPAPDLDAQDARELTRFGNQQQAEEEQIEALNRAEREALRYKKANKQVPQEVGLPVIHSMQLDTPSEIPLFIESLVINGERSTPREPLPPPALLRNLPPPPKPKPLLVEPVVAQDRFGRMVEQRPLGLTEPTPVLPLPDPERSGFRHEPPKRVPSPLPEPACGPVDRLELPPRRIFDPPQPEHKLDPVLLEATKDLIGQKLTEFKVKGQMVGMQPGPVVTVYEFQPDPGVPLARVMGMEEDLALGLQAEKVRIDRIPGRNLVGIEVPNLHREVISFREIVDSPQFRDPSL